MTLEAIRIIKEFRETLSLFEQEILFAERKADEAKDKESQRQLNRIANRIMILDEELECAD